MARLFRALLWAELIIGLMFVCFIVARKFNAHFRPAYPPSVVFSNPNGRCALVQHPLRGGERGIDPFAILFLLEGDAFYTVVDLQARKVLRDSTTQFPSPPAYRYVSDYMGWRNVEDAYFPGGEGPYHEWNDLQCGQDLPSRPSYAGLLCFEDQLSKPECRELFNDVSQLQQ